MKSAVEKTFLRSLILLHSDPGKTKQFMHDKRLTKSEKEILYSWLLLRDNHSREICELLQKISDGLGPLVKSQKYLIWGIALNNSGQFQAAVEKIEESLNDLDKFQLPDHLFIAFYNLFIANYNLQSLDGMQRAFALMSRISSLDGGQQISRWQCQLLLAMTTEEWELANEAIEKLEALKGEMSEPVIISYLVTKFRFEIILDDYSAAIETLAEMKKHRKFALTGNYLYMKTMLDYVLEDAPIYVYRKNFEGCLYLFWQLKVIESLQRSESQEADDFWEELQKVHPNIHQANFTYTGEKCLFSLALERVKKIGAKGPMLDGAISFRSKEEHLLSLLKIAKTPVSGAMILKTIWNIDQIEFTDYAKLKKLVSRVRIKHRVDIQFKKGCYFIVDSEKLTQSS